MELDAIIHEPARLLIMTLFSGVETADFAFLLGVTGLTKGNLSAHVTRLEGAGYVEVRKSFHGRMPHTEYRLTPDGHAALAAYWEQLDAIRMQCVQRKIADFPHPLGTTWQPDERISRETCRPAAATTSLRDTYRALRPCGDKSSSDKGWHSKASHRSNPDDS